VSTESVPATVPPTTAPASSALRRLGAWYEPASFDQAIKLAGYIAASGLAPKGYENKPQAVLVAMAMGAEVGLGPLASLQNIAVINGRPSLWGDAMLAVCMAHAEWEGYDEQAPDDKNLRTATCTVKRRGMKPVTRTFSMNDAKQAGLDGKQGPWTQYPKRMLQLRARAFALRDAFADALRGIACAEESQDVLDVAVVDPPRADAPPPAPSRVEALKQAVAAEAAPPAGADTASVAEAFADGTPTEASPAPAPALDLEPADAIASLNTMARGNGTPQSQALSAEVKRLAGAALKAAGITRIAELSRAALNLLYADACAARERIAASEPMGGAA